MLSNTTSYKLKASKSSRDLNDFIDSKNQEGSLSDEDDENASRRLSKYYNENEINFRSQPGTYSTRDSRFNKSRNKSYEYRSGRGTTSERRNNSWRGRGTFSFRKYDSDSSDVSTYNIPSRKFQEPVNKHFSTDLNSKSLHHSKYYESEKPKCEYGFLEDTRISKLIRRLTQETDQEKCLELCKKLLDALLVPDNSRYVRRAFSMLVEALYDVLVYNSGVATKQQAARVLGRIGYVMETDIRRFFEWQFFNKYQSSTEEVKVLLISSFKETLNQFLIKKCPCSSTNDIVFFLIL